MSVLGGALFVLKKWLKLDQNPFTESFETLQNMMGEKVTVNSRKLY